MLFNTKSFQKQFRAFLKAPEFYTLRDRQTDVLVFSMFLVCFAFNLDGLYLEIEIKIIQVTKGEPVFDLKLFIR